MEKYIAIQYNLLDDVTDDHRTICEEISGMPLEELDITDVNDYLNELYLFHKDTEEMFWKSLSYQT